MSSSVTSESHNFETTSESDLIGLYCPTCNLSFEKEDQFKLHYHSDIHSYNMKRKIVGLKPATDEQFQKQLQKMHQEKEKTEKKNKSYYCEVLNQKFSNYTTYANRLTTKKYQKALEDYKAKHPSGKATPGDVEAQSIKSDEKILEEIDEKADQPAVDPSVPQGNFKKKASVPTTLDSTSICLFTNIMYESFEKNLEQMKRRFGFFILDEQFCHRKEDLVKYLAKVIQKERVCIYCNLHFKTSDSVQKHIVSKQHALMNSEYFAQYDRFYDFREENLRIAKLLHEQYKDVKANNVILKIKNQSEPAEAKKEEKKLPETNEDIKEEGKDGDDGEWEDDEAEGASEDRKRLAINLKLNTMSCSESTI